MNPIPTATQIVYGTHVLRALFGDNVTGQTLQLFVSNSPTIRERVKNADVTSIPNALQTMKNNDLSEFLMFYNHDDLDRALMYFEHCKFDGDLWIFIQDDSIRLVYNARESSFFPQERRYTFFEATRPDVEDDGETEEWDNMMEKVIAAIWKKQLKKYMFVMLNDMKKDVNITLLQHPTVERFHARSFSGTRITYRTVGKTRQLGVLYTPRPDLTSFSDIRILEVPICLRANGKGRALVIFGSPVPEHHRELTYYETSATPFVTSLAMHEKLRRITGDKEMKRHRAACARFKVMQNRDEETKEFIFASMPALPPIVSLPAEEEEQAAPEEPRPDLFNQFFVKKMMVLALYCFFMYTLYTIHYPVSEVAENNEEQEPGSELD